MILSSIVLAAALLTENPAAAPPAEQPLKCEIGPVHRTFGDTKWLVYSCNDQSTMVVLSDAGNPASPFYFVLQKQGNTYKISGEGNGRKAASDAAGNALSAMTADQLADLLAATKAK